MSDLRIQTSTYGRPIPIVLASGRVGGNVIWAPDKIKEVATTEDVSKKQEVTNYTYFGTCAIAICEGPLSGIRRVWADGEIIYDASTSSYTGNGEGNMGQYLTFYMGTEEQMPDPTMQSFLGADKTPAHRGVAYVVMKDMPLEKFGNRIPNLEFEVLTSGTSTGIDVADKTKYLPPGGVGWSVGQAYDPVRGRLWSYSSNWPDANFNVLDVETGTFSPMRIRELGLLKSLFPQLQVDANSFRAGSIIRYEPVSDTFWVTGTVGNFTGNTAFAQINPDNGLVLQVVAPGDDVPDTSMPGGITCFAIDTARDAIWFVTRTPRAGSGSYLRIGYIKISTRTVHLVVDRAEEYFPSVYGFNGNVNTIEYEARTDTVWVGYQEASASSVGTKYRIFGFKADGSTIGFNPAGGFGVTHYTTFETREMPAVGPSWFLPEPSTRAVWFYDGASLNRFDTATNQPILVMTGPFGGATADGKGNVHVTVKEPNALSFTKLIVFNARGELQPKVIADTVPFVVGYDVFADGARGTIASNTAIIYTDRISSSSITVANIFREISRRVHLDESAIDVSAVSGADYQVQGFAITTRTTARSAFEPLMTAYALNVIESGGKVKIVPRATAPLAASIPFGDLAAHDDADGAEVPNPLKITRAAPVEVPTSIELNYSNPELEYRDAVGRSRFSVQDSSVDVRSISVPLVMAPARAEAVAEMLLAEAHQGLNSYELQVGISYLELDPGDVIDVESEDGWVRMLIDKIQFSPTGLLRISAHGFDYSIYQKLMGTPSTAEVIGAKVKTIATAGLMLLDIPILSSADNAPGFYALAYCPTPGADIGSTSLFSSNDGSTYNLVKAFRTGATVARANSVLANCTQPELWDTVNTVIVTPTAGALYSATDAAVLNGANLVLLGSEILQFATAELRPDGSYTLSRLLRGRKGTEAEMATHKGGETLVLLDANVKRVEMPAELSGVTHSYKLVGQDQSARVAAEAVQFTNKDVGLECYSPVKLVGTRDEATGDLVLTWVRRTRVGGELRDKIDAQLGEQSEAYEIDVLTDTGIVKRTLQASSPTLTYTSAQQIADFGASQASVSVKIHQLSAAAGRGFPLDGTV